MARRRKLSRKSSKRSFRRGTRTANKNLRARPMRGGYRI